MDAYYIDASVAPFFPYASPLKSQPFVMAPPPHLVSQRRMQELVAPTASSSSSSAVSSASGCSPQSSLPTVLTVSEIEDKLADALLACRAAMQSNATLESSDVSSDDDLSDDEFLDQEFSSEDDDDIDDADDEEEAEEEPLPTLIALKDDSGDSHERRMRRICAWRASVAADDRLLTGSGPGSPSPVVIPTHLDTIPLSLSRKRKATDDDDDGDDGEDAHSASVKRVRIAPAATRTPTPPLATCAACGASFPSAASLQHHGSLANPSEACRAAIAYCLEV